MTSLPFLSRVCLWLERGLGAFCLLMVLTILGALGLQVFFRYLFSMAIGPTDEIAKYALIWGTFLGVPWAYRRREHIAVDIAGIGGTGRIARAVRILGDLIVAFVCLVLIVAIIDAAPMALRFRMGSMQLSRFWMHYLPLGLGLGLVVLFTIEKIALALVNAPDLPPTAAKPELETA